MIFTYVWLKAVLSEAKAFVHVEVNVASWGLGWVSVLVTGSLRLTALREHCLRGICQAPRWHTFYREAFKLSAGAAMQWTEGTGQMRFRQCRNSKRMERAGCKDTIIDQTNLFRWMAIFGKGFDALWHGLHLEVSTSIGILGIRAIWFSASSRAVSILPLGVPFWMSTPPSLRQMTDDRWVHNPWMG